MDLTDSRAFFSALLKEPTFRASAGRAADKATKLKSKNVSVETFRIDGKSI